MVKSKFFDTFSEESKQFFSHLILSSISLFIVVVIFTILSIQISKPRSEYLGERKIKGEYYYFYTSNYKLIKIYRKEFARYELHSICYCKNVTEASKGIIEKNNIIESMKK